MSSAKNRPFVLIVLGALFQQNAPAQVSIGTRVGLSLSRIDLRSSDAPELVDQLEADMVPVLGFDLVVPIELPQSQWIAVQPEVGVVMKGMAFEGADGVRSELRCNYAEIALLIKGRFRSGAWRGDLLAGPGFMYGLSARAIEDASGYGPPSDQLADFDDTEMEISGMNFAFGGGLSYGRGVPTFFVNYRYVLGLTDVFKGGLVVWDDTLGPQTIDASGFHRSSVISIGMFVPLSRSALRTPPSPPSPQGP